MIDTRNPENGAFKLFNVHLTRDSVEIFFTPLFFFYETSHFCGTLSYLSYFILGFVKGNFYNSFLQRSYISCDKKKKEKNRNRKRGKKAITNCILVSCIILTCIEMLLKCLSMNGRGQIRRWIK